MWNLFIKFIYDLQDITSKTKQKVKLRVGFSLFQLSPYLYAINMNNWELFYFLKPQFYLSLTSLTIYFSLQSLFPNRLIDQKRDEKEGSAMKSPSFDMVLKQLLSNHIYN